MFQAFYYFCENNLYGDDYECKVKIFLRKLLIFLMNFLSYILNMESF